MKRRAFRKARPIITVAILFLGFLIYPILVAHSQKPVADISKDFIYQPDILKESLFGNESKQLVIELTDDTPYLRQKRAEEEKRKADEAKARQQAKPRQIAKTNSDLPSNHDHLLAKYDWPVDSARKIMNCESGGVATKHNYNPATKDNSWGLYQVNLWGANARNRPPSSELIKPEVNIAYAYNLYVSQGRRFGTTGGWYNCAAKHGIR